MAVRTIVRRRAIGSSTRETTKRIIRLGSTLGCGSVLGRLSLGRENQEALADDLGAVVRPVLVVGPTRVVEAPLDVDELPLLEQPFGELRLLAPEDDRVPLRVFLAVPVLVPPAAVRREVDVGGLAAFADLAQGGVGAGVSNELDFVQHGATPTRLGDRLYTTRIRWVERCTKLARMALVLPLDRYLAWNDRLAARFFREAMAGRPVYLYTTEELVANVARELDETFQDFIDVCKAGPAWATREGLCQKALQAAADWRDRDLQYPPYINYLCLFVLGAGHEGDFASHAYYPRLRELLDDPGDGALPSFHRMLELWDDLERWAVEDKAGDLGVFEARISGGWIHVGLPIAQTILTEEERHLLPEVFAGAGLDPTSPPPDDELARLLRSSGRSVLTRRTLRLLEKGGESDRFNALLEVVADELSDWDGTVVPRDNAGSQRAQGSLRLCATWDPVQQVLATSLRCRVNGILPEDDLFLSPESGGPEFICCEALPGWSTPLVNCEDGHALAAVGLNLKKNLELRDRRTAWSFWFRGSPVRVLVDGRDHGLPGLVEVFQAPRSQRFLVAADPKAWARIADWATSSCEGLEELDVQSGLPSKWRLGRVERIIGSGQAPFALLQPPSNVRLRFVGGIRSSPGGNYFAFAPPMIQVAGGSGMEEVTCNGMALQPGLDGGAYGLPADLVPEARNRIEVKDDTGVLKRRSLFLTGDFAWGTAGAEHLFDEWGSATSPNSESPGVSRKANLRSLPDETAGCAIQLAPLLCANRLRSRRIVLVGRSPGEISAWKQGEELPTWAPFWAVLLARRGEAIYCGGSIAEAKPASRSSCDARSIREWKSLLWSRRKRIKAPATAELQRLWRDYQSAARDA